MKPNFYVKYHAAAADEDTIESKAITEVNDDPETSLILQYSIFLHPHRERERDGSNVV